MLKLSGIYIPVATPFDYRGEVYKIKVTHNVESWNRVGAAGLVACSATGESASLSFEEKLLVYRLVAQAAAPEKTLIAGIGAEGMRESIALANEAAEIGYQAALIENCRWLQIPIYARTIADQIRIPLILSGAQATQPPHPNIAGSLATSEQTLHQDLTAGAPGAFLPYANAHPYSLIAIWEAFRTREHDAALDWQNRISHAAKLVTEKYGIPGLKHSMDLNGYYGGPPRLPLTTIGPEAKREIEEAFEKLKS